MFHYVQNKIIAYEEVIRLNVETLTVSATNLLVGGAGILMHYDDRTVKFMQIFLYGQGGADAWRRPFKVIYVESISELAVSSYFPGHKQHVVPATTDCG